MPPDPIDKSAWGPGPWQDEPDEKAWSFGDVECRIARHPDWGQLNGYVGIPPGHPWFGKTYDEISVDVHGGLTFCGQFDAATFATPTNERLWYVGFDCHHYLDRAPGMEAMDELRGLGALVDLGATYKTIGYVKNETENLATQAIGALRDQSHAGHPDYRLEDIR